MSSIERYLKQAFERRNLPGLKARYQGPPKMRRKEKAGGQKLKSKRSVNRRKRLHAKREGQEAKPKPVASIDGCAHEAQSIQTPNQY